VLSRITEPTCGEIRVRGRLASLLEVGTGFHPELTRRSARNDALGKRTTIRSNCGLCRS
jgi:ABC-type polysaccharide/polyol phosphate transport system ATPase subunit